MKKRHLFWERALLKRHPCLIPLNLLQLGCAHKKISLGPCVCALRFSEFKKPCPSLQQGESGGLDTPAWAVPPKSRLGTELGGLTFIQGQRTQKNEVICVHVAPALNTRSHFWGILLHCGEFVFCFVWAKIRDSLIFASANGFWSGFLHLSCRKKIKSGHENELLVTPEGDTALHSASSHSWALQLCKPLLQEIYPLYTHCVHFASYKILNSPHKEKWMNYWSCTGKSRGNRENIPWCDAASTHSSGMPGEGNPVVHGLGHFRWISGTFPLTVVTPFRFWA